LLGDQLTDDEGTGNGVVEYSGAGAGGSTDGCTAAAEELGAMTTTEDGGGDGAFELLGGGGGAT